MTKKSSDCYEAVFNFIRNQIFDLKPAIIMTDWEAGMRCAIRRTFPDCALKGCWYHYCAAIRKKLISLGLRHELKKNAKARITKQMIMSLPLLPNEKFDEGYAYIKSLTKEHKLWKKFENFFAYYDSYWICQVTFGINSFNGLKLNSWSRAA